MDAINFDFDHAWIDVNGFTKKDWAEIHELAQALKGMGHFKGDAFRCIVASFILWIETGGAIDHLPSATENLN